MSISSRVSSEILSKCSRVCCLCKEFKPLNIQIHHIIEKSEGGSDCEENLIPICIECHSNIHTETKMTKRYSNEELRKCKEEVFRQVSKGILPSNSQIDIENEMKKMVTVLTNVFEKSSGYQQEVDKELDRDSIEILSAMICENTEALIDKLNEDYFLIEVGRQHFIKKINSKGQYPKFILNLIEKGLIHTNANVLIITNEGTSFVNKLIQNTETYIQKKIKCFKCGLHFVICTWYENRHLASTIYCPECGQHENLFLVWSQKKFGFIFEEVPGNAQIDMGN